MKLATKFQNCFTLGQLMEIDFQGLNLIDRFWEFQLKLQLEPKASEVSVTTLYH